jgi:hypothetical protein
MIGIRGQALEGGQLVNLRLAVGQLNFSGGCRAVKAVASLIG